MKPTSFFFHYPSVLIERDSDFVLTLSDEVRNWLDEFVGAGYWMLIEHRGMMPKGGSYGVEIAILYPDHAMAFKLTWANL